MNKFSTRMVAWLGFLILVMLLGTYVGYIRFTQGLGAVTALSDVYPWGLWIGVDDLVGVALAAGGFVIAGVTYALNIKRFKPIARPAILTAFIGYIMVILGLVFDIGQPERFWHPMVMWQERSVMFEVYWLVLLCTGILAVEFSPAVWEKLKWYRMAKFTSSITIPLVILGIILSTLHQSSIGALFMSVSYRYATLRYSTLLPLFFFISAVSVGIAMVTVESIIASKTGRHKGLQTGLLTSLAKANLVVLVIYLILRIADILVRGVWWKVFLPDTRGLLYVGEITVGIIIPILLLSSPAVRKSISGLFISSALVVTGVITNRLSIALIPIVEQAYFPSWMEFSITAAIIAFGLLAYTLATEYLPVFHEEITKPMG